MNIVTRADLPPDKPIESYENETTPSKKSRTRDNYSLHVSPIQKSSTKMIILEEEIVVYRVEEKQKEKSSE